MNIKLTKYQVKKIREALYLAIEWEESCIDSCRTELKKDELTGHFINVIPKELKSDAKRSQRNIDAFKIIRKQLKEYE